MAIPVSPAVSAQISVTALDGIRKGNFGGAGIEAAGIVIATADAQGRLSSVAGLCAL